MVNVYLPLLTPPEHHHGPTLWFVFQRREMLVCTAANRAATSGHAPVLTAGAPPTRQYRRRSWHW